MNIDNIFRLANHLDTIPDMGKKDSTGFTMSRYIHTDVKNRYICSAPACVAGWACWMANDGEVAKKIDAKNVSFSDTYSDHVLRVQLEAAQFLGLDKIENFDPTELFVPSDAEANVSWAANVDENGHVTARHAAAVLRHLAETGEVDWSVRPLDPETEPVIEKLLAEEPQPEPSPL